MTCSDGEQDEQDISDLTLTLYIDGSAMATARQSNQVRGVLFKYYLDYRDSFLAECFVSLNQVNLTVSARQRFPANYSSPVARPFTSEGMTLQSYNQVFISLSCLLLCVQLSSST